MPQSLALMSPPAAQTDDSIALLWNKIPGADGEAYAVYADDAIVATTPHTDFTLRRLAAGKSYAVRVVAMIAGGEAVRSDLLHVCTKPAPRDFDITAFGAIGDGRTLNTTAIQAAIDACGTHGRVRIPKGQFLSGAIFLKSEMTLFLEEGGVLLGSPEPKDYPVMTYRSEGREKPCYASLINTVEPHGGRLRDISVTGSGLIDGNGVALFHSETNENAAERGRVLCFRNTDGVYLQGVTLRRSPFWCVHPIYCTGVSINGITIRTRVDEHGNPYGVHNNDGIDPDSCRDVFIFDCDIASQDDCIALKSGRDADGRAVGIATENVRISHCRFHSGFGVACGSEMSGGIRNVLVEDCVFTDTFSIASVKAPRGRGGVIEDVTYRDCTLINTDTGFCDTKWFRGAIYVDQFYGHADIDPNPQPVDASTAVIRNIRFENLTLDTVGGNAVYLGGLPERPLEDIRFTNVKAVGKHGFIAQHVRGLSVDGLTVEAREGQGMRCVDVGFSTASQACTAEHSTLPL